MIKLRPYQQQIIDKIQQSKDLKNCVQLATGGGKTVIFSEIARQFKGRVLIVVNRIELLQQSVNTLTEEVGTFSAETKTIPSERVVVGMVETIARRKAFNINDFDLVIIDECHNLQFVKIIQEFKGRLLGFTATPKRTKLTITKLKTVFVGGKMYL